MVTVWLSLCDGTPDGLYIARDLAEAYHYAVGWSKYGIAEIYPA